MSYFEKTIIQPSDDFSVDAFHRFRISSPFNLFDSKTIFDKRDLFYSESFVSGGTSTFITNNASIDLGVTTANGSSTVRQTKEYFSYQSGRSQLLTLSLVLGTRKTGVTRRAGLFDASNGFFLEQTSAGLFFVLRTFTSGTAVDTRIAQADWNIDRLDGTGNSGMNIDETKINLMIIDFTWQGAGKIRFGFYGNSGPIICHEQYISNINTTVSITTPCLPIRHEIFNTSVTASSSTLRIISSSLNSEGGTDLKTKNFSFSADNTATVTVANNNQTGMIAVRLKSAFNRIPVSINDFEVISLGTGVLAYRLHYNPTVTGGTWVSANANSAVEYNITLTSFTAGIVQKVGYISAQQRQGSSLIGGNYKLTSNISGVSDIFLITCEGVGNAGTARASISWNEEW